jgi:hypothetical protein
MDTLAQKIEEQIIKKLDAQDKRWHCHSYSHRWYDSCIVFRIYWCGPYNADFYEELTVDNRYYDVIKETFDVDGWYENYQEQELKRQEFEEKQRLKELEEQKQRNIQQAIQLLEKEGYTIAKNEK